MDSSEKYRIIINSTHTGYHILDAKGRLIDANDYYVKLTGHRKLKEILGKSILKWTVREDREKNKEALKKCLKDGFIENLRVNYISKKKVIPVEINARVISENGKKIIVGVCHDISNLVKAEEKYKSIFNSSKDVIINLDLKGIITDINPAFNKFTGYDRKDFIGKRVTSLKFVLKESLLNIVKATSKMLRGSKIPIYEVKVKTKYGIRVGEVSSSFIRNSEGKAIGLQAIVRDITQRKQFEEELKKISEINKEIIEKAPFGIYTINKKGKIDYANKAMLRISGDSLNELIGLNTLTFKRYQKIGLSEKIRKGLKGKGFKLGPVDYVSRRGKKTTRIFTGIPLKEKLLIIVEDITEKVRLWNAINIINETLTSLGSDHLKNIKKIVNSAGKILGGACLLYNRLDKNILSTWGVWHEPPNYNPNDKPEGHICYDVIKRNKQSPFIIEDLTGTRYEKTDPNVIKYKLKSYLGIPIILNNKVVGSFCVVDTKKRKFTNFEIKVLKLLGKAIANEEERLSIKQSLIRSKEKFEKYLNLASVIMVAIDKKGKVTYINKKGCKILGYREKEIVGKNWFDNFIPKRIRKEIKKVSKKALSGHLKKYINPILTKNGEERLIRWHTDYLKDDDGNIVGYLSSGEDITEEYKVNQALKESEAKFKSIIEKIKVGIILGDEKGNIIEANRAAEEIYGIKRKNLLKMKVWELASLEGLQVSPKIMKILYLIAAKTGKVRNKPIVTKIKTNKGMRMISFKLSTIKKEKGNYIIQLLDDVTEQHKAMMEIQKEKDLLQKYIDLSGLIIAVLDKSGKVTSINKKGLEIFNYKKEQVIGKSWFSKFVPPEEKVKVRNAFNKVLINGVGDFESNIVTSTGEKRLIDWHSAILKNDDGKVIGVLNTGEDITEKRKRERELRKLKEEVEINEARKNFLLLITHELKQPLTPIMGYADLLKENETNVDKLEYLDRIINGANEMYELVTKIINLMRIETGQLLFHFREISLKQLIDDALRKKASLINLRSIRIKKDVKDAKFIGDYNLLRDLLVNLIDNAVKFSKDKQTVTITGKASGKWVTMSVKDEGQGIKKEDIPKLFKTFSQTVEGRKKGGFGIGLSMCKMIAEKHGGTISVKSEWGKGSTFTVKIPRRRNENHTSP